MLNSPTVDELLAQAMRSNRAPELSERLAAAVREEQARRREFVEKLSPSEKAEFINGEAVFHSPVQRGHNTVRMRLSRLLHAYVEARGLGEIQDEKVLVSLTRNDFEPDICFFSAAKAAAFTNATMRFPPPDLVVEVLSPSTEANGRGVKLEDYADHGVREYWIVDPDEEFIEQRVLPEAGASGYVLREKTHRGIIECVAISGLRLPARAAFDEASAKEAIAAFAKSA